MFSRNSASSRAIPFEKMVKMVEEDPFIPIAWQKSHQGMQGTEYFTDSDSLTAARGSWLLAAEDAVNNAKELNMEGITKQLANRLLEPFMWHTVLVTATEFSNFFELRCPSYIGEGVRYYSWKDFCKKYGNDLDTPFTVKDLLNTSQAEIHIQALAESMWDAYQNSVPKLLTESQWHIPFIEILED